MLRRLSQTVGPVVSRVYNQCGGHRVRGIHTVSDYLVRQRLAPIPKGNCGIIAMIGESLFESSEALDRLACMKHRGGIVGNGSDGVGIGIGIGPHDISERFSKYKPGMLIGQMSLPKGDRFDSFVDAMVGDAYSVPDHRYVHIDDQFRPDSDGTAPFDVVQFLLSRKDEQPIQDTERLSLLVTSEFSISRRSSVAHLWSLASDHLVFKSMAWPEHLRQYFCDEIPQRTNTIYGHVRMATNSEPLLRFVHPFHWGNQNNGENNGALATRLACISLLKEQFPMLDLPDLSANSDSYDLGLYLTLLQLKGFQRDDVFSHVFRLPSKGLLPVSPIPDAYPPYSGPFYGIYYDNNTFLTTAGDLNVRPAFVAYDGNKTVISSEMYDPYNFHSLPTGTWRMNNVGGIERVGFNTQPSVIAVSDLHKRGDNDAY